MNSNIIEKRIIPNKLICNKSLYEITLNSDKYVIKKIVVFINRDNKIEKLFILDGIHPNCNPKTKEFCIPNSIKQIQFDKNSLEIIENTIKIFNFDSAFFQPWNDFNIKQ